MRKSNTLIFSLLLETQRNLLKTESEISIQTVYLKPSSQAHLSIATALCDDRNADSSASKDCEIYSSPPKPRSDPADRSGNRNYNITVNQT